MPQRKVHPRYCVNQPFVRFDQTSMAQTCWRQHFSVVKSRISLNWNSNTNALRRTNCVTMSVWQFRFGVSQGSSIHRSADLMLTTSATTKKLRHRIVPVSMPRRRRRWRCANKSVGSNRIDARNQCRSFDRSVVWRRFLRMCPRRLGYVDDRWRAVSRRSMIA